VSGEEETLDGGHLLFPVRKPSLILVLRASQPEVRDKDDYLLLGFITPFLYEFLHRMFTKYLHNLLLGGNALA
jgi:hypothetical protein